MENDFKKSAQFLKEHGKYNDSETTFSIKQSDYEKLAAQYGLTKEILNTTADYDKNVWNAGVELTTDLLEDKIKKAKKAGDDPKDQSVTVSIMTRRGNMKITQSAYKEHNNPQAKDGAKTPSYGSARLKLECKSKIVKDHLTTLQGRIQKAVG